MYVQSEETCCLILRHYMVSVKEPLIRKEGQSFVLVTIYKYTFHLLSYDCHNFRTSTGMFKSYTILLNTNLAHNYSHGLHMSFLLHCHSPFRHMLLMMKKKAQYEYLDHLLGLLVECSLIAKLTPKLSYNNRNEIRKKKNI